MKIEEKYKKLQDKLEQFSNLIELIPKEKWVVYQEDGINVIDEFKTIEEFLKRYPV